MTCSGLCALLPGGRLISLNKISLEGVTFSDAAAILQSSPDEVELIVSQPKCKVPSVSSLCHLVEEQGTDHTASPCSVSEGQQDVPQSEHSGSGA